MPHSELSNIPLTQLERLRFIERQLMWGREFKARMLIEKFGVSRPQVVTDLKQYMALFPKNVNIYNPVEKAYTPSEQFTPELIDNCDDSCVEGSYLTKVPVLSKTIDPETLSLILTAIQNQQCVELIYGSNTTPLGKKRLIYPTRLLSTTNRFHFRGYCTLRKEYRDFVVSRCLTKPVLKPCTIELPKDNLWDETIEVKLTVNPNLPKESQELISHDYIGKLDKPILLRKAMLHYFLIDNNIPSSKEHYLMAKSNPWSYPLLIERNEELDRLLFSKE